MGRGIGAYPTHFLKKGLEYSHVTLLSQSQADSYDIKICPCWRPRVRGHLCTFSRYIWGANGCILNEKILQP